MHLQQTAFESIVVKGEIANYEQFLNLPQCFQLHLSNVISFTDIFYIFGYMFLNMFTAADLLYVGKG